jgi:hypothetical protein
VGSENWHDCNKCGLAISHEWFPLPDDRQARIALALRVLALMEDDEWCRDAGMFRAAVGVDSGESIDCYRREILRRAEEEKP